MSNNQTITERSFPYSFEISEDSIRTTQCAQEAATIFLKRVKSDIAFHQITDEDERVLITEFMVASVLNIEWYRKKLGQERLKYWGFVFLSFGLLLFLPLLLFYMSTLDIETKNVGFNFAGLLVAILSSIIAFQKAFTGWFKTRLRRGEFWRASSRIKEILYQLEGEYNGLATTTDKLKMEFKEAIRLATSECRKVASDEQQKFFDQQTLPDFELGKAWATARTEAVSLISFDAPPAVKPNKSGLDEIP
jgi:hypothetical protein